MEVAELLAGLDTELLHQRRPSRLVGLECLGLAPGAVQGEHQLSAQALAERMLLDHPLDLADQLGVAAEGEIGGEAILDRGETQLRQASDVRLGKALEREVVEWGTAPECERLVQHVGRLLVPSCR